MPTPPSVNLADVPSRAVENGDISFVRRRLGAAAGSRRVGCSHYEVPAGARQIPVHAHADEEEVFFVLEGSGLSWQDGEACEIGRGDTIVHRAMGVPHTILAGDEGIVLLAFSSGTETHLTWLPRPNVMWANPRWLPLGSPHPFAAEAAVGPLERPEPGERPSNVVALADVELIPFSTAKARMLGRAARSAKSGLNHVVVQPGTTGAPPHCHALEEELFYVLEGGGTVTLGDDEHPLREGDVIARPPGTGVPHTLTAGPEGMTYLAFGTREAGDSVYYPETGKIRLRGLGVTIDAAPAG